MFTQIVNYISSIFSGPDDEEYPPIDSQNLFTYIHSNGMQTEKIIGEGNFGKVWKASVRNETPLNCKPTTVAVKILGKNATESDDITYFSGKGMPGEAHGLDLNRSDQVVKTHALITVNKGKLFLYQTNQIPMGHRILVVCMEYLDGYKQHSHPESMQRVQSIAKQILNGVNYLHENGIIHRDIKPENILVNREGSVKIIDLSFLERVDDKNRAPTHMGTILYSPPEFNKCEYATKKFDIWAIGATCYEMVFSTPLMEQPFVSNMTFYTELKQFHKLFPTRSTAFKLEESFWEFVGALLEKCPEKRPQALTALKYAFVN